MASELGRDVWPCLSGGACCAVHGAETTPVYCTATRLAIYIKQVSDFVPILNCKTFFYFISHSNRLACLFSSTFHPGLIFAGEAGAYPNREPVRHSINECHCCILSFLSLLLAVPSM